MKIGFGPLLKSQKFKTIEGLFIEHTASSIFFSRFLATSLGPAVNILAGFTKTNYKKFLFWGILGEILYVTIFAGLGYIFGDQWETISSISQDATSIIVLIIVLIVLARLVWRVKNTSPRQVYLSESTGTR